jgi:hypothetical protein
MSNALLWTLCAGIPLLAILVALAASLVWLLVLPH